MLSRKGGEKLMWCPITKAKCNPNCAWYVDECRVVALSDDLNEIGYELATLNEILNSWEPKPKAD